MKAGDFFEHPVKNTGKMVRLIAISSDVCDNCIFKCKGNCESADIGIRQHDITGSCSIDKVIYQQYEDNPLKTNDFFRLSILDFFLAYLLMMKFHHL